MHSKCKVMFKLVGLRVKNLQHIVCVFVLSLLRFGETTTHCTDGSIVGMASPDYMTGGGDIRRTYGRGYVMTNAAYTSHCCGTVQGWTFNMDRRALSNPVQLCVWRPVLGAGGDRSSFRLVGRTDVYAEAAYYSNEDDDEDEYEDDEFEDGGGGRGGRLVSVFIPAERRISIQQGDVIGWRSPEGDVISYTPRYYNLDNIVINWMDDVQVGSTYVMPSHLTSHRTYGINAVLTSGAAPVLSNLPATVELNSDVTRRTPVFNVTGYDANSGDALVYLLADNEDDDEDLDLPFILDPVTGMLLTRQELSKKSYEIRVMLRDSCGLYDLRVLTIIVKPKRSPPKLLLPETLEIAVGDVNSDHTFTAVREDDDSDDVTCGVTNVQPFAPLFSMNGTTFRVRVLNDSTFNSAMTYNVSVTCYSGRLSSSASVGVRLFHHTPPVFVNSSGVLHVSARVLKPGDVIHVMDVLSPAQLPLTFFAEDCQCPFLLHPDGSIAVVRSLMSEPVTSYSMDVFVTDDFVTIGPKTLLFILTEINQAPEFVNIQSTVYVDENSVGVVAAFGVTDPDTDLVVSMVIEWFPERAVALFSFNETSRTLEVGSSSVLDFERLRDLGMTRVISKVTASDGYKSSSVNVTVIIGDVNEPPEWLQSRFHITVEEGQAGTVLLSDLNNVVRDPDVNDTLTFSLPTASEKFKIDSATGTISFAVDYDVDRGAMPDDLTLVVQVVDGGLLSATAQVHVKILNVNEPPKIMNLPREITVPEDANGGALIYRVFAEDPDEDDLILHMSFEENYGDMFFFNRRDGTLSLKHSASVDFETRSLFVLHFTADDGLLTSSPATLTLRVSDVNEAPYFSRDVFYVTTREGPAGSSVGDIGIFSSAYDPDHDPLTFDLLPSPAASDFSIDSKTAQLSFAADCELTQRDSPLSVNLSVRVRDVRNLTAIAVVKMNIHNINKRPRLLYLPSNITISEEVPEGTLLYTLYAEDEDGDRLIFRFNVLLGGRRDWFDLNSTTGQLTVAKGASLRSAQTSLFKLQVSVTDGFLSSQAAILEISVVGGSTPREVARDPYVITVREDELAFPIPRPRELEPDEGPFSPGTATKYRITGGNGRDHITIDPSTGSLTFDGHYDIDEPGTNSTLTLEITAESDGSRPHWVQRVKVEVVDINDNAPEVTSDILTFFVSKTSPVGTVIGHVEARDLDAGANGELDYGIVSADSVPANMLNINANGVIVVNRPMSSVSTSLIKLEVIVSDRGRPSLRTTVGVFVVFN